MSDPVAIGAVAAAWARVPAALAPDRHRACDWPLWVAGVESVHVAVCDGVAHFDCRDNIWIGHCPDHRRREIAERVTAERQRLAPIFERQRCVPSFENYEHDRHPSATRAAAAARLFVGGTRGLFLSGAPGLGKTHLLLASHLLLLSRGVRSVYVRMAELRKSFLEADSDRFDGERKGAAEAELNRIWGMDVVHLDELGEGTGDSSGKVYLALKAGVDGSRARFAVAACKSVDALCEHPDVTEILVSRFLDGAARCEMAEGADQRIARRV